MGFEEIWNEYTSSEKDMFQKSVRRLLKQTFIVRDRDEDSKKAYYFVSKRSEPFSAYLGYIGYDIVIDRENGVIMLQNCRDLGENGKLQINHVTLKKMESVVLWSQNVFLLGRRRQKKNLQRELRNMEPISG